MNREEFNRMFSGTYIIQDFNEFFWLFYKVARIKPKIIVELGVEKGGTLRFWNELVPKDEGLVVGIDFDPGVPDKICWNWRDGRVKILIGDTTDPETVAQLKVLLDGRKIDFLFIDASYTKEQMQHQWQVCEKEFQMYSPFVRPGGLIGFHDVGDVGPFIRELPLDRVEIKSHTIGTAIYNNP